jgi:hypothetical protein
MYWTQLLGPGGIEVALIFELADFEIVGMVGTTENR